LLCDEPSDACVECLTDGDCGDALFCNGIESCINFSCRPGIPPCAGFDRCNEAADECAPSGNEIDPTDDDGDMIFDGEDLCPGTPAGEVVDASGCSGSQPGGAPQPEPDNDPISSCGNGTCGAMSMVNVILMIAAAVVTRASRRHR